MEGTNDYRDEGHASPASQNGYIRLAAAILANAANAAKAGDLDAAQWLLSGDAEILADGIGLSWPHVQRWARLQLSHDQIRANYFSNLHSGVSARVGVVRS